MPKYVNTPALHLSRSRYTQTHTQHKQEERQMPGDKTCSLMNESSMSKYSYIIYFFLFLLATASCIKKETPCSNSFHLFKYFIH